MKTPGTAVSLLFDILFRIIVQQGGTVGVFPTALPLEDTCNAAVHNHRISVCTCEGSCLPAMYILLSICNYPAAKKEFRID